MPSEYGQTRNLHLGLDVKRRANQLPPGVAQVADNVRLYPQGVSKALGHRRIINTRKREPALIFDGRTNYLYVRTHSAGSSFSLTGATYGVEVFFNTSSLADRQTLMCKASRGLSLGTTTGGTYLDWEVYLDVASGLWQANAILYGTGGPLLLTLAADSDGDPIEPNTSYSIALIKDGTDVNLYLKKVSSSTFGTPDTAAHGAFTQQDLGDSDLFVGAMPVSGATHSSNRAQYHFAGVIQELRFYNANISTATLLTRDDTQLSVSSSDLLSIYSLTGASTAWRDGKLAQDFAYMEPTDARWTTGIFGTYGLLLDGHNDGFPIRNTYRLRNPDTDENNEFPSHSLWGINYAVKLHSLPETGDDSKFLWHWVHAQTGSGFQQCKPKQVTGWTTGQPANGATAGSDRYQAALELFEDPDNAGEWQIRFCVQLYNVTTEAQDNQYSISTRVAKGSGGLVVDTAYSICAFYDSAAEEIRIFVDGVENTTEGPIDTSTVVEVKRLYQTDDDPVGSSAKYWMEVGRSIKRIRKSIAFPGDPNDVEIELDYDSCIHATIDQMIFFVGSSNIEFLARYFHNNQITRKNARSLDAQILLMLQFESGAGGVLEDFGQQALGATFLHDAGHVRGESLISTTNRGRFYGLFNHTYRSPAGTVNRAVAVSGAAVYQIVNIGTDVTTASKIADGLRNDSEGRVMGARALDSLILTAGGEGQNYHLWKDQLYRLSIVPPVGPFGFGVVDQTADEAKLEDGIYRYVFTYLSRDTGKRSPIGVFIQIEIKNGKANIAFGSDAPSNQTYPKTGKSVNKPPYNMSGKNSHLQTQSWIGAAGTKAGTDPEHWESAPGTGSANNAVTRKKAKFTNAKKKKHPVVDDIEDVSEDEVKTLVELKAERVEVKIYPDEKVELIGKFSGASAHLYISNKHSNPNDIVSEASGVIGFTGATVAGAGEYATVYSGTEATDGQPLPVSRDLQVTNLEIWRTHRDGTDFRRVALLPNGQTNYVDNIPDDLLTGSTLKINGGAPPVCRFVVAFGRRHLYFGFANNPQRLMFSEIDEPWNVPPQNIIDLVDGDSGPLIMAGRTESVILLTKRRATFIISPSTNAALPFRIDTRMTDLGGVSPFGAVNRHETLFYPSAKGIVRHDGTVPEYLTEGLESLWQSIPAANWNTIEGVHYELEETIFWFYPTGDSTIKSKVSNDRAISYYYRVGSDGRVYFGWSKLTGLYVRSARYLSDGFGKSRLYLMDQLGFISVVGKYDAYGPDTTKVTTTTTAAQNSTGTNHVYIAQLNHVDYDRGYEGMPVTVVDSDGTRETRYIITDNLASPSKCTVDHDFSFTPASGDVVILGAIDTKWTSGEIPLIDGMHVGHLTKVMLDMEPATTAGEFTFAYQAIEGQGSDDPEQEIQVSNQLKTKWEYTPARGRRMILRLESLGVGNNFEVTGFTHELKVADRGQGGS